MKVSVIVPVYNVRTYLEGCVKSILAQTFESLECILVDDGSTDGSGSICDALARRDSRIKVVHKPNGGLSDARNAGLDVASGDYVGFVDSDDWVDSKMYEVLLSRANRDNLDVVCGNVSVCDLKTGETRPYSPLCAFCADDETVTFETVGRLLDAMFNVAAWNKLYKRSVFATRRFPKGAKFEDVPVWTDILFSGARSGCVDHVVYTYNIHRAGSIVTTRDYRDYPDAWQSQYAALADHGLFAGALSNDFAARLAMKFIQAYNLSSPVFRKEFFKRTQSLFREFGTVGIGRERGWAVGFAAYIHYKCCRMLPYTIYRILFAPEMLIANPSINAFLKRLFHGRRVG